MVKDAHYISMDTNAHRNFCTARDIYEKGLVDENESRDSFVVIDANYVFVNNILELFVVTHTDGNNFVDMDVSIFVDQK